MPARTPADPCLTLITLGRLDIAGATEDGATRLLRQPKRLGVLAYLLLSKRGASHSREEITAMFWPESDSDRARNALRQTVSFLRSCLGPHALTGVGSHGIAVSPNVQCDAAQFESLLDDDHKQDALKLYGGELLPGFHIDGAYEFSQWLESRRRHLGQRAAKAAWDLSAEREAEGNQRAAAFWGKRALALSPFSESEVQRVLRLLDRVGDLAGALRAYHGLQQSLREYGAAPSAETRRLAEDITRRVEASGQNVPALLGTRRSGQDRRVWTRRQQHVPWTGEERRENPDRREAERRSGLDRRAMR